MARLRPARAAAFVCALLLSFAAHAAGAAAPASESAAASDKLFSSLNSEDASDGGVVITAGVDDAYVTGEGSVASVDLTYTCSHTIRPPPEQPAPSGAPVAAPLRRVRMEPVPELDGGWRATIPVDDPDTGRLRAGSLVRFAVVARDARGAELARRPQSVDAAGQRIYRGHVVKHAQLAASSKVPAFFWYTDNVEGAKTDQATPGSAAFAPVDPSGASAAAPRFYDEIEVHREGSGRHDGAVKQINAEIKSKDWPKHKFQLHFLNKRLRWLSNAPAVRRISLRSMYKESGPPSYIREALALRLMKEVGVPSQESLYVRLFLNGEFYGLYLMVEEIDSTWLQRQNWPADTMLLKAQHWKYSNLRAPDLRLECPQTTPDQQYSPGPGHGKGVGCPIAYQVVSPKVADKWDRSRDELVNSFAMSIEQVANRVFYYGANDSFVLAFWRQRVDTAQVVTEMAAQTLILNIDRCTKNHVYAHLKASDQWRVIPEDLEDAFATDSRRGYRNCAAEGWACKDAYCYLSCPSFNSVLFCDKDHPQDSIDGSTFNHLTSAVLWNPDTKSAYFSKLKQLLEIYNNNTQSWLIDEAWAIKALIADDARADAQIWHTTNDFDANVQMLVDQISQRRTQLYQQVYPQPK